MKGTEERIRKGIGEEMRKLGSRSFYVRTRSPEGGALKAKIWMEKGSLDLLGIRKDALKDIRRILQKLEEELGVKIQEEFKPL